MTYFTSRRAPAVLAVAVFLVLISGCSGHPSATGTASFNGTPVDDGTIVFSLDGKAEEKGTAKIVDGKFTIPSSSGLGVGKNRVEIYWNKKTGKKVGVPGDIGTTMDETVQVIPAQFNTASTLTEEVKSGSNTFTFELKGTENVPGKGGQAPKDGRRNRD